MKLRLIVFCIILQLVLIVNSEVIYDKFNYDIKTAVTPLRYDIYLTLDNDPHDFKYYNGSVKIQLMSNIESNKLIFHYNQTDGRQINFVKLINLNKSLDIDDFQMSYFEYENNSFTILESERDNFVEINHLYSLSVVFRSDFIESTNKGFFKNCHTMDDIKRCYAVTQFEITHIRETIPCFDEINFKTHFNIQLTHHRDLEAISNMPVKSIMTNGNDAITTIFEQTPLMATYILAFAVGNFNKKTIANETNVQINIYTSSGSGPLTPMLVRHTAQILKLYENYLNIDYALPKLDFLIINGYNIIGMENWGLIIVRDVEFLQDQSSPSLETDDLILNALAHELAHQFFGNLVTIKERRSLFLSEGFATYFASRIVDEINPAENYGNRNMLVEQIKSLQLEQRLPETILNNFHPNDTIQETIVSYLKGGSFIRMLNHVLGERSFRQMLINYMAKYKYGSVTTNDLIDEIRIANKIENHISDDVDIGEFVNSWINQDKFPIVKVTRNYETGDVEFRQDSFKQESDNPNSTWWIPINYVTEFHINYDLTVPDFWLQNTRQMIMPLGVHPNEWIIINKNAAYYYVVLYDERNLELIAETLASENYDRIPAIDRAKLIGDLGFLLATGHQINKSVVKQLLQVMCHDTSYITWSVFQIVWGQFNLKKEHLDIFSQIESKCSKHLYDHYGTVSNQDSLREKQLVQALAVSNACDIKYEKCLNDIDARSLEYLHAMETNSSFYVTKEIVEVMFKHGFRDNEDLERIYNYVQSSSNDNLKEIFFSNFLYHKESPLYRKLFVPVVLELELNEAIDPLLKYKFMKFHNKREKVNLIKLCLQENCYDFEQNYPNLTIREGIITKVLDLIN